jgi:hypothetical protein
MSGEEADGVCWLLAWKSISKALVRHAVYFCARVDDALRVMREAREVDAVLLALELLRMLAFPTIVDLESAVIACNDGEFARVIEVERRYGRLAVGRFEALSTRQSCDIAL